MLNIKASKTTVVDSMVAKENKFTGSSQAEIP